MKVFEVIAQGFDGSTDATDDHVLWVLAWDKSEVEIAIAGTGATCDGVISELVLQDVDFAVPDETEELRERLRQLGG